MASTANIQSLSSLNVPPTALKPGLESESFRSLSLTLSDLDKDLAMYVGAIINALS